ncbi:hypothetical protein BUALT_Bualt10G0009600 [Buddleja alternifolia]|uniref:glycerol-3-phosphate 1-O-acyltransferase n=1 Tax=Buddleja alternifolia TaxID=168488 RepID=A0AAV6WWV6_9LAMI|nr:hypothetical protein BUALT_Bualt10G0009600 [Buddleja alternifolia]
MRQPAPVSAIHNSPRRRSQKPISATKTGGMGADFSDVKRPFPGDANQKTPWGFRRRTDPRPTADRKRRSTSPAETGLCTAAAAALVATGSAYEQHEISQPQTFLDARTEQDLLLGIQKEAQAGRLPLNVAQGMEELYHNYRNAVFHSGHPKADEIVLSNMAIALDRIFKDVGDPFQFSPYPKAIREPFDYYLFGQKYIGALIDFRSSFLVNTSLFIEMEKKLQQNVILVSNHQTEADSTIIALLLESISPFIVENMICVEGDRVVTGPLCKPFSMGRNLLCVYSKKHMNDDPELIDMKKRANTKSLKEMVLFFRIEVGQQLKEDILINVTDEKKCMVSFAKMICVEGDRVVTGPLCKPFSMERNLLCVYSKKHMEDDPELINMKKRANMKRLKEMVLLLRDLVLAFKSRPESTIEGILSSVKLLIMDSPKGNSGLGEVEEISPKSLKRQKISSI